MMASNKQGQFQKSKAGCYAVLGQKKEEIELPLKYFDYEIEIVECFSYVKMTQLYINNQNKVLDVSFIFPIHHSCIVTNLQMVLGGNRARGVVMQRGLAEKQYKKNVEQGAGAAYSAYSPQSRDVMKMKVGNIPPKEQVKIILCYSHINSLVCNRFYQFKLASTMTPRYAMMNQQSLQFSQYPESNTSSIKCSWGIKIQIKPQASRRITKIQSKSHKINVDQSFNITFAKEQLPNRDFSLYYAFQNYQKPTYILSHSDNTTTVAISFIPKFSQLSLDDAISQAKEGKGSEVNLDAVKGEYIFLLDRSGSMQGIRIDNAKRSLQIFLRSLPQDSYFNVLSFGTKYQYLFQKSKRNQKKSIDEAVERINKMAADMNGTQILQAIQSLVSQTVIQGYPRQLFFLTDGAVTNVSSVLKFVSKHTQYTRVNSIGVGNGCSEQLIQGCAQRGKGYCAFIRDEQKPEQKIIALLENAISPVISKVNLLYDKSKVECIVPNPNKIPYILKNDIASFFVTFKGKLTNPFNFQLNYTNSIGKSYSENIKIAPYQGENCSWIENIVNYQKIKALSDVYEYGQSMENRLYYVKNISKEQLKKQITVLSIKHQILTDFTAFLCIDASLADDIKKQNLQKSKESFKLNGMRPYDTMVTFCQQKKFNSNEAEYVDECCIVNYEDPPEQLRKISKFEQVPKVCRPMQLKGKIAGGKQFFVLNGISEYQNPQKRLAYIYIVKKQETNGSWREDFISSLFTDADKMRNTFREIDKISMITFLVCQYLIRFYSSEAQFSMIIKKGKNYIDKNSNKSWSELLDMFHKNHYDPIPEK